MWSPRVYNIAGGGENAEEGNEEGGGESHVNTLFSLNDATAIYVSIHVLKSSMSSDLFSLSEDV